MCESEFNYFKILISLNYFGKYVSMIPKAYFTHFKIPFSLIPKYGFHTFWKMYSTHLKSVFEMVDFFVVFHFFTNKNN